MHKGDLATAAPSASHFGTFAGTSNVRSSDETQTASTLNHLGNGKTSPSRSAENAGGFAVKSSARTISAAQRKCTPRALRRTKKVWMAA